MLAKYSFIRILLKKTDWFDAVWIYTDVIIDGFSNI